MCSYTAYANRSSARQELPEVAELQIVLAMARSPSSVAAAVSGVGEVDVLAVSIDSGLLFPPAYKCARFGVSLRLSSSAGNS